MLPAITWGTWEARADSCVEDDVARPHGSSAGSSARRVPRFRVPTKPLFHKVLDELMQHALFPLYSPLPLGREAVQGWWNWEMPDGAKPTAGLLPQARAHRKTQQVANMASCFEFVLGKLGKRSAVVVEFCASSGYICLPLACKFPECQFVLLDMNATSLTIARHRLEQTGIRNVRLFHGLVEEWAEPFDIGVALHACGEATDMVQAKCIACDAAYVLGPCCVGKVQHSKLSYPRSKQFSNAISVQQYRQLASAADFGHAHLADYTAKQQLRRVCKSFVELDRNLHAEEAKSYQTRLVVMDPSSCTPKNDILIGWRALDPLEPRASCCGRAGTLEGLLAALFPPAEENSEGLPETRRSTHVRKSARRRAHPPHE